jgi:hypothetical protein
VVDTLTDTDLLELLLPMDMHLPNPLVEGQFSFTL